MAKVLVVGGGFRGIVASYFLARAGHDVTLSERGPFLGGVLHGEEWDGFFLDKGCHLLSNDSDDVTDVLLDILQERILPVDFRYASIVGGCKSEGFAIPDLTAFGQATQEKILYELVSAAADGPAAGEPDSLDGLLAARFGPTAAACLRGPLRKMLQADAKDLDPSVMATANFNRVRALPEGLTELLKHHPLLDERLAASSQDDPMRFVRDEVSRHAFRNFYPAERGMRGFCDAAQARLESDGVALRLGSEITAISPERDAVACVFRNAAQQRFDQVFWTVDGALLAPLLLNEALPTGLVHRVPMILYYFVLPETDVGPYTYIHDFEPEHLLFRASAAGSYGRQVKDDGTTFLCCEVTTTMGSPEWEAPEEFARQVWREAADAGIMTGDGLTAMKILKTPVSYRVGKRGYGAAMGALSARLAAVSDRIVMTEQTGFYRNKILKDLASLVAA